MPSYLHARSLLDRGVVYNGIGKSIEAERDPAMARELGFGAR